MDCPKCKKKSLCGCRPCKRRRINKMPTQRSARFKGDDLERCPYCREDYHMGYLEDLEYQKYLESKKLAQW